MIREELAFSGTWIEDWWPVAVIGGGIYLIIEDGRDRRKQNVVFES